MIKNLKTKMEKSTQIFARIKYRTGLEQVNIII